MSWLVLAFLGYFFQVQVIKFGTNVGLNMLINISSDFVITTKFFGEFFFLKIGKKLL